jgi:DNA-binding transcriptional regulator YiaG
MMRSSLKAALAQAAPTRAIGHVRSGSPDILILSRIGGLERIHTIEAMLVLRCRGVSALKAKRAIEAVVESGLSVVAVPRIESHQTMVSELASFGIAARPRRVSTVDVSALRQKTGLSQEDFALQFNLDLATLQGWEQGRRLPDLAAENYLRVIERSPQVAIEAVGPAV